MSRGKQRVFLPAKTQADLAELLTSYRSNAPRLTPWFEENVPEGLPAFTLPERHRRCLHNSNPMERAVR